MNFEQLKSFSSVAVTRSFSQAAKERFLSQPTVSNQVKALENELGVQLLDRTASQVQITENGERFLTYIQQILELENKARNCFYKEEEKETVDIIAPGLQIDFQLSEFLIRAESEMRRLPGGVIYRVVSREDEEIPKIVLREKADFGITSCRLEDEQLRYLPLFVEEIVFITPNLPQYRNMSDQMFRDVLQNDDHVRFDFGEGSDYLWNDFFGRILGVPLHNIKTAARCSNHKVIIKAVERNMGVAFVSNTVVAEDVREQRVLAYRCKDLLQKQFYLVYRAEQEEKPNEIFQKTKEMLLEEVKKSMLEEEVFQ